MRLTDEEVASMRRLKASFDQDRGQPLPDLSHTEFCWFVSDQLKSLLETFEPDRHQYIPINLCDYPTQYYLLIVHQTTDCVIPSQTAIRNGRVNFSPSAQRGLDADSIIGLHLWCDPCYPMYPFVSDALKNAMFKSELTGMKFRECELFRRDAKNVFQPVA